MSGLDSVTFNRFLFCVPLLGMQQQMIWWKLENICFFKKTISQLLNYYILFISEKTLEELRSISIWNNCQPNDTICSIKQIYVPDFLSKNCIRLNDSFIVD